MSREELNDAILGLVRATSPKEVLRAVSVACFREEVRLGEAGEYGQVLAWAENGHLIEGLLERVRETANEVEE